MSALFIILALVTLCGAALAMSLRNLVHSILCLVLAFAGLAGLYLNLNAEFIGWVQLLVYVGAVSILLVFAILLTRSNEPAEQPTFPTAAIFGFLVALMVSGTLIGTLLNSQRLPHGVADVESPAVKRIGELLMSSYVLPLEVVGILLTVALIGGIMIARNNKEPRKDGGTKEG